MYKLISFACFLLVAFFFYIFCVNHVSVGKVGVACDSGTGTVSSQPPGYHITSPLVNVYEIPTTPFWVSVTTSATIKPRRLVQFDPTYLDEFIKLQGFSFMTARVDGQSFHQTLFAGYAFSGKTYSFLKVLE